MLVVRYRCSECDKMYRIADDQINDVVECPSCGAHQRMGAAAPPVVARPIPVDDPTDRIVEGSQTAQPQMHIGAVAGFFNRLRREWDNPRHESVAVRAKRDEQNRKWREENPGAVKFLSDGWRFIKWSFAAMVLLTVLVTVFYDPPPEVRLFNKQHPGANIPITGGAGTYRAAYYLPPGTRAEILKREYIQDPGLKTGVEWIKIRVVSSDNYGDEGWTTEHLIRDLPPPTP